MSRATDRTTGGSGLWRKVWTPLLAGLVLIAFAAGCQLIGGSQPEDTGRPPVILAAGDIADCSSAGDESTAKVLAEHKGTVITLGDNAYEDGTSKEFADCYDPSWGQVKDRTRPVAGNHDYHTPGAKGYFGYFGDAAGDPDKGYYSYDVGEWHLIALNSNCGEVGGCETDSRQGRWLEDDLAASQSKCTLAYFHHPLFSSGLHGKQKQMKPLWETLYAARADLVLNGHDHDYQRYTPQSPDGSREPGRGVREFVVGTGGMILYPIEDSDSGRAPLPNLQSYNDDTYGVLKLDLHPKGYTWQFLSAEGSSYTDSGKGQCV